MITIFYLKIACLPDATSVNQFFFVSCDVYLVQNQTVTVQNGTNFREIINLFRDLLSCLMSCYQVDFRLICLKRQLNSTSYYVCILWDNFQENITTIHIVASLGKFWDIFVSVFVSFFAATSPYNIMDLRNNVLLWCQETSVVETGALLCVDFGSHSFQIIQITFFVGLYQL